MESTFSRAFLKETARKLMTGVSIADRKYRFKKYANCFVGKECVQFMLQNGVGFM